MDKGIEFMEEMSRLIFDGKIIGYEYKCIGIGDKVMVTRLTKCLDKPIKWLVFDIEHDSFNQGIKIGDEWWFTGDIIKVTSNSNNSSHEGKLIYYEDTFYNFAIGHFPMEFLCAKHSNGNNAFTLKKIGSIYDEVKDDTGTNHNSD